MPIASPTPAGHGLEWIAHRGVPTELTENTLPGFLRALERGADAVELDVHVCSDSTVVVHHDAAAGGIAIADTPWDALSQVTLPGGWRIPRLAEVLEQIGPRATVYIEIKGTGSFGPETVVEVARARGERYAIHSFDHGQIEQLARIAPDIARGVLLDRGQQRPLEALAAAVESCRPRDVWPHWTLINERFMEAAAAANARVIAWTVNAAAEARRLMQLGVAGLCTDDVRMRENL